VILESPAPTFRSEWRFAVKSLQRKLSKAARSSGIKHALVPVHLAILPWNNREFVQPLVGTDLAKDLSPHRVKMALCLIDDIHDVYARLLERDAYWDNLPLREEDLRRGHSLFRHVQVLLWRSQEILATETLCRELKTHSAMLAVKHLAATAARVIAGEESVYLSHPITEARRVEGSAADQEFREQLWTLGRALSAHHPVLEPTTIDEFRVQIARQPNEAALCLRARFFGRERYGAETMFSPQEMGDSVIYHGREHQDGWVVAPEEVLAAQQIWMGISELIEKQVTARDLRLVSQCRNLVVFRPRFRGTLSIGVAREISYFNALKIAFPRRYGRIVIVDSKKDEADFKPRQFLEGLAQASIEGTWSEKLAMSEVSGLLDRLSARTRSLIGKLRPGSKVNGIRAAVDEVMRDWGRAPNWHTGVQEPAAPLGTAQQTRAVKGLESFLGSLRRRLADLTDSQFFPDYAPSAALSWLCIEDHSDGLDRAVADLLRPSPRRNGPRTR